MNTVHWKNNTYKNGEYNPSHSKAMVREKRKNIVPTLSQKEYRDDLYKFCIEKELVKDGFRLGRTSKAISSNIRGLITIIRKHGFDDEFFGKRKQIVGE